jgi:beta-barrel assembly-enhancing protease
MPRSNSLVVSSILVGLAAAQPGCAHFADVVLPKQDEAALGKQLDQKIQSELKLLDDPEVNAWVRSVGARVAAPSEKERAPVGVRFYVVDDPKTVNAFAIPGGSIYVYSGLLLKVRDEAELAGVLGHEVGHVAGRHAAQQLSRLYGVQLIGGLALGQNPSMLAQLGASVVAQGYLMRHSRGQERDADRRGVGYLYATNYDPRGMAGFFEQLGQMRKSQPGALERMFASHPEPDARAREVRGLVAQNGGPRGETKPEVAATMKSRLSQFYASRGQPLGLLEPPVAAPRAPVAALR